MPTGNLLDSRIHTILRRGVAIPAHPLALNAQRKLDERRQRALSRYYLASGVGGLAVGVHTTQFAIRDPGVGLFEPVLTLAAEEMDRADGVRDEPVVRIAGVVGATPQAIQEADAARRLGYHAVLLGLKGLRGASDETLIVHCQRVAQVMPVIGFYLQQAVGGQELSHAFWRRFCEIDNVVAIKIAPFDRYRTIDVVRAVIESGREGIALYTGNDDNIVADLVTPFRFAVAGEWVERRIVGGLLGHWAVWTRAAVELLEKCHRVDRHDERTVDALRWGVEVSDMNGAVFDVRNQFQGVISGVHEILRRQGLLEGTWCLNPQETLGPGQAQEIDRVTAAYPHWVDDAFVAEHRDQWLSG